MANVKVHPQIGIAQLGLGAEVRTLIETSGRTYRDINEDSRNRREYQISTSSISRVVNGKAVPTWKWLDQLLKILDVPEQVRKESWRPKLEKVVTLIAALQLSAQTAALLADSATGAMCPICFAWAVDPGGHQRWHQEQVTRQGRPQLRLVRGGPDSQFGSTN